MAEITIAELRAQRTMSAEMAAVLWAAVDERQSFSPSPYSLRWQDHDSTPSSLCPSRCPSRRWRGTRPDGAPEEERRGGYLQVAEFAYAPVPGYIWGPPVRRVRNRARRRLRPADALHAPGVEAGMLEVTEGNGISDERASTFKLVMYIERFGYGYQNLAPRD
jgi:hypothetical protein